MILVYKQYKDNTYTWTDNEFIYGPMSKCESIAKAVWEFRIPKREILKSFEYFTQEIDIAIFRDNLYFYSKSLER